ncbi:MAG TPA: hypothetical protein VII45_12725 [Solirubrobacterales bacterium]
MLLIAVVANALLEGGEDSPFNPIARAAERAQQSAGGHMEIQATYTSAALPDPLTMTGSGEYNTRSGRSRATLTMPLPAPIGSVEIESVGDEHTVYMHSKMFAGQLPSGKEWMAIEPWTGNSKEAAMAGNGDAESQLKMLRAAGGDVKAIAHQVVGGVPTTVYEGTTDPGHYASTLRDEGRESAAREYEEIAKLAPSTGTIYAWIDDDGVLRQMRLVMTLPAQPGGSEVTMDMRIEFSDFGIAPEIDLPAESEVFDATPALRAAMHLSQ